MGSRGGMDGGGGIGSGVSMGDEVGMGGGGDIGSEVSMSREVDMSIVDMMCECMYT